MPDADHIHAHHKERGGEAATVYLVCQVAVAVMRAAILQLFRQNGIRLQSISKNRFKP
ncbi:hypothetical protein NKI32_10860 [Mesorhizobium sp. M0761]|nr:hypothetical protein [Mesorhizobium sp. LSHC412B00]